MRSILLTLAFVHFIGTTLAFAQGGKAEPKRVEFANGRTAATVSAILSNNQEMDFIFSVEAGQTVDLRVTSKPKGNLFDFRLMGNIFEFNTDLDSYSEYSFKAQETGDYLVFVRKRPTRVAAKAKFFLVLKIE